MFSNFRMFYFLVGELIKNLPIVWGTKDKIHFEIFMIIYKGICEKMC